MSVLKKLAAAVPTAGLVLGLLVSAERPASGAVLDFEGIDVACDSVNPATSPVPFGYGGLVWSAYSASFLSSIDVEVECDENYQVGYANGYGAPSPTYAAYNSQGFGEVNAAAVAGTFTFGGASFTSFAYEDDFAIFSAYSLAVQGYQPGDAIGSPTYSDSFNLSADQYDAHAYNWTGLNLLVFLAGDGLFDEEFTVFGGDGRSFLFDDVSITFEETPVPEPASLLLFGTAIVAAARARKRRQAQSAF